MQKYLRILLVAVGSLLLCGCLDFPDAIDSDTLDVPIEERANIPALEGSFYALNDWDPDDRTFQIISLTRGPEGKYLGSTRYQDGRVEAEDSEEGMIFLETSHPDIVLALYDTGAEDPRRTSYALFFRSQAGSWIFFPLLGEMDSFTHGARAAYLDPITKRHGLVMQDGTLSFGTVPSIAAIRSLFSDPDFLTGLLYESGFSQQMLPMQTAAPVDLSDPDLWWIFHDRRRVSSERFDIPPDEIAQLPVTSTDYRMNSLGGRIIRGQDGVFDFDFPGSFRSFQILDIGAPDRFLGLEYNTIYGAEGAATGSYDYSLIRITGNGGVRIVPIEYVSYDFSKSLHEFGGKARQSVVERHGMTLSDSTVIEHPSAQSIRSLFLDPKFQVGLQLGRSETASYEPREPVAQ